jgi:hypothetical protein
MIFEVVMFLLAAHAGPGTAALASAPAASPSLAAFKAFQKGFEAFQEETREQLAKLAAQNEEQQAQIDRCKAGRRLQSQGEAVTLFKRPVSALVLQNGADGTGHRILQAVCDAETLKPRTDAVTAECCDEPGEDCSGGAPRSPNAGCCGVLVPFFQDCAAEMGAGVDSIRDVGGLCPAGGVGPAPTASAVLLFSAVCPPGVLLETCIPYCDESTNGDVLLLQQAGNDMRLLCEMNSYFFSWIGAPPPSRVSP